MRSGDFLTLEMNLTAEMCDILHDFVGIEINIVVNTKKRNLEKWKNRRHVFRSYVKGDTYFVR